MLLGTTLYRALLREAAALPDTASSAYYRLRIQSHFRREPTPESSLAGALREKAAQKLLRELQAANDGYLHSLVRVLETTYGRRGPLKHRLLDPFTTPTTSHSFSPPLSALLTSTISHNSKPPSKESLVNPPTLPDRAFEGTEDYRLLGPLTLERIKAIRRRYRTEQLRKVKAPIAVQVTRGKSEIRVEGKEERDILMRVGLRGVGGRGEVGQLARLEELSRVPLDSVPRKPRRLQSVEERETKGPTSTKAVPVEKAPLRILSPSGNNSKWHLPKRITPRLLRRRYQAILDVSPIFVVSDMTPSTSTGSATGEPAASAEVESKDDLRMSVVKSPWTQNGLATMPELSVEDLWWIEQSKVSRQSKKKGRSRG